LKTIASIMELTCNFINDIKIAILIFVGGDRKKG
jgi:hypothetical protein